MRTPRHRLVRLAMCTVGVAALLVGCGAGGGAPSDFCKSVDALAAAVKQINQTSLSKNSIEAVETSMATLDTAVTNLSNSVESEFSDEVRAVESAATELGATVSAAVDSPDPANMSAARTSMSDLTAAVNELDKASSDSC